MKLKTTLLCEICSALLFAGQAETYHATEGTLDVMDTSLAVYYPFDDADELGTDKSGYANGTLTSNGTAPTMQSDGVFGGCCRFNNSGNLGYFSADTFPASIPTGKKPVTICMWAKTASTLSANRPMLAYGSLGYGSMLELALYQTAQTVAATTSVNIQFAQIVNWSTLTGTLPDSGNFGSWHSIVFVLNNGNYVLYLDGQEISSGKPRANGSNLTPILGSTFFVIGKSVDDSGQNNNYQGSLDEVAIFSRAFDAADAAAYHASSVRGVSTSAVKPGSVLVADANATLTVKQYTPTVGGLYGTGTVKADTLTVSGVIGAGANIDGNLTLGDNVVVAYDSAGPIVVSGGVSISGAGTVFADTVLPAGDYVLMQADSFSGVENLHAWNRRVGPRHYTVKVVDNELVLSVTGCGLVISVR